METIFNNYNVLYESICILNDTDKPITGYESRRIQTVLEDANSPVTKKYQEKLFQSIIDKKHIDFGSIPESSGNIKSYSGYNNMIQIIDIVSKLAMDEKNKEVLQYTDIIRTAINNIISLSATYSKGFVSKCDYVMLEYNTYVYTCVEATSTLLYEFVDYIKRPDKVTFEIKLKNTKFRADLFYFDQLRKFNNVNAKMGIDYRKMLENLCQKDKSNFLGAEMIVGAAAISIAALAIVPITRELIYRFYHLRGDIAKSLEMQASFLEMNRACVEANDSLTIDKKKKILEKQNKIKNRLLKIADFLKVKNAKSVYSSKKDLKESNKMLSIDALKDDVSNSPLELL